MKPEKNRTGKGKIEQDVGQRKQKGIYRVKDLLVEIGCEEIPASFLQPATKDFAKNLSDSLTKNRIGFGSLEIFYTPRRIAVLIKKVKEEQEKVIREIQGPPKSLAFDSEGKPTKVALGFTKSHKISLKDVYTKRTQQGVYLFYKKVILPLKTKVVLKNLLPDIIQKIPFSKTMRWHESETRFARPIRWIVLIYGCETIKITLNGIKSSNYTYGHRIKSQKPIRLKIPMDYEKVLKNNFVIPSFEERRKKTKQQLVQLAKSVKGVPVEDEELMSENMNTVEYPQPVLCAFRKEFLSLPKEVLITALKYQVRCFSIKDKNGNLLPYFIAITNTPNLKKKAVKNSYERTVESRLADAQFYFDEDIKKGLVPLLDEEKRVTWIEGLGSLYDKTERLIKMAEVFFEFAPELNIEALKRACLLSKTDLLTNMVREKEFTSLQGIIGGIYAQRLGEDESVAQAISEQYLPKSAEDRLPFSKEGAVLSIIDKLDNIIASFLKGEIPTSSFDPFALRRQATAILSVLIAKNFFVDLEELINKNLGLNPFENTGITLKLSEFFKERLSTLLIEKGFRYDVVASVVAVSWFNPTDAFLRSKVIQDFRTQNEFTELVIGQKRVNNILKDLSQFSPILKELIKEAAEIELFSKANSLETVLGDAIENHRYEDALRILLSLRTAIDALFDNVLVMTDDEKLRNNRLALLDYIRSLFLQVADFSQIVLEGDIHL